MQIGVLFRPCISVVGMAPVSDSVFTASDEDAAGQVAKVYDAVRKQDWGVAALAVHSFRSRGYDGAVSEHACSILTTELMRALPVCDPPHDEAAMAMAAFSDSTQAEAAEKIILMKMTGHVSIAEEVFHELVHRSIGWHQADPQKVRGLATLVPDSPYCNSVLRAAPDAAMRNVEVRNVAGVEIRDQHIVAQPGGASSAEKALLPLYRSLQEREFHTAVSTVFMHLSAVANVGIITMIDLQTISDSLTRREFSYARSGIVDIVLYDPTTNFSPTLAFELDSPLHDDATQHERDTMKNRILALAGLPLVRVRPDRTGLDRTDFTAMLLNDGWPDRIAEQNNL